MLSVKTRTQKYLRIFKTFNCFIHRYSRLRKELEFLYSSLYNCSPPAEKLPTPRASPRLDKIDHMHWDYPAYISLVRAWSKRMDLMPHTLVELLKPLQYADMLSILLSRETNPKLLLTAFIHGCSLLKVNHWFIISFEDLVGLLY